MSVKATINGAVWEFSTAAEAAEFQRSMTGHQAAPGPTRRRRKRGRPAVAVAGADGGVTWRRPSLDGRQPGVRGQVVARISNNSGGRSAHSGKGAPVGRVCACYRKPEP